MEETIELVVTPVKKVFYNDESAYGIYGFDVGFENYGKVKRNPYGNITAKGTMPELELEQKYVAVLKEYKDMKYGHGYIVESIKKEIPTTAEGQREFLKHLTSAKLVDSIFEAYPDTDIIQLIHNDEFDIDKVKGVGKVTYEKLKKKVEENLELQEALSWLGKYGIKYNMVVKLVREFKSPLILIQKLEENPYLLTKVKGMGFIKTDSIALQMGIKHDSPHRIRACIVHCIEQENQSGNAYIKKQLLLQEAQGLLKLNRSVIAEELIKFLGIENSPIICIDEEKVSLTKIYRAEKYVANKLTSILYSSKAIANFDVEKFLKQYCKDNKVKLTEEQRTFFHRFSKYNVNFLIGYAGTGKSFMQKVLLNMLQELKLKYRLLSPTGKAAKVLTRYTGVQASTIHRALAIHDSEDGQPSPIEEDVILVDESSMCDVYLVQQLLRAMTNPATRIIFIGDDFQLPSVQVGNFLFDCINSGIFPVTKLTQVFRQQEGGVLDVATNIRQQNSFVASGVEGKIRFGTDMILHAVESAHIEDGYKYYYKRALTDYNPEDIMVLSPTRKGQLGVGEINRQLQEIVNPPNFFKKEHKVSRKDGDVIFRVGDYIMNVKNTYKLEVAPETFVDVFNGDTGKIVDIDKHNKVIIIDFDDCDGVPIKFEDIDKLMHCYGITIHKSQGSGAKVVIMITDKAQTFQINANLLYTGVTRTQERLVLLSQAKTINAGIKKVASMKRNSFLGQLIEERKQLEQSAA